MYYNEKTVSLNGSDPLPLTVKIIESTTVEISEEDIKMGYILLALATMVLIGVSDFLLKKGIAAGIDINVLAFYFYLATGVFFAIFCAIKRKSLKINKTLFKYSLLIGLLLFVGTFSGLIALKSGNASVIIPIVRMGFVVTAICAFVFLKEKITFSKGLGLFFAALSLVLLSM